MQIWVDADACPVVIREILFRAAERTRVRMTLVANKPLRLPAAAHLRFLQVPPGFDAADKRIVELMSRDDLVVTADVPLAAAAIEKGGVAIRWPAKRNPMRGCAMRSWAKHMAPA